MGNFKSYDPGEQAVSVMLLTMKCTQSHHEMHTVQEWEKPTLGIVPRGHPFPLVIIVFPSGYLQSSVTCTCRRPTGQRQSWSWEGLLILQTWWLIMETKTQFPWEDLACCQGPTGTRRTLTCIMWYLDRGHTSARKKQFSAEDPRVPHLYIHRYPGF